jgi:hypothetical protein
VTDTSTDAPFVAHSLGTSLFFSSSRLFVAGNPKAAGTALRWWLLEAHGVDVAEATADSLWGESAPDQVVWDGRLDLRHTWDRLDEATREDALSAPDVLSVLPVRHPVTRTFASWASKYLTGEPYYEDRLPEGFPRLPEMVSSADDIAGHFADFVTALAAHVEGSAEGPAAGEGHGRGWADIDVHFWPQDRLLARTPGGSTLLLRQEQMTDGIGQVSDWLAEHGVASQPPARRNEAVVAYRPACVAQCLDTITRLYASDLSRFGYDASAPDAPADEVDLAWLNDVRGRNRRYAVVHEAALESSRRAAHLERQLREVRGRDDDLHRRIHELETSTSWQVTSPLRRVSSLLHRD